MQEKFDLSYGITILDLQLIVLLMCQLYVFLYPLVCHDGFGASYTSAFKLERLRAADVTLDNIQSISSPCTTKSPKMLLRSKGIQMNWNLCVFCQQETKENVHILQEKPASDRILTAAEYDPILRTRLACVNVLMAADSKHHSSCHVRAKRQTDKIRTSTVNGGDTVLLFLCHELQQLASHDNILELADVWERYCILANDADIHSVTFDESKEYIQATVSARLDDVYEII